MGQVLHGSATTTEAVRRAIQLREDSVRSLDERYSFSPTTVQKSRKRTSIVDVLMSPEELRSTVLTVKEEAVLVAFRRHTLLPLEAILRKLGRPAARKQCSRILRRVEENKSREDVHSKSI